ncbi:hypothetical protein [Companilactobacillus farciminis]|nr:hypothetical protein [Companilactobacillus farciminis]WCG36398.1 hypothetical protein PML84_04300 [Companilactobacillus farciminis]
MKVDVDHVIIAIFFFVILPVLLFSDSTQTILKAGFVSILLMGGYHA